MTVRQIAAPALSVLVLGLGLTACGGQDTTYADAAADAKPATGPEFEKAGFDFHAPKGWTDGTATAKQTQSQVSVAAAAPSATDGFKANINVIAKDDVYSGGEISSSELTKGEKQISAGLRSAGASATDVQPRASVAGATALHISAELAAQSVTYRTEQYFVFHDGTEYTVTFSFPTSATKSQRYADVIEPTFASWTWST